MFNAGHPRERTLFPRGDPILGIKNTSSRGKTCRNFVPQVKLAFYINSKVGFNPHLRTHRGLSPFRAIFRFGVFNSKTRLAPLGVPFCPKAMFICPPWGVFARTYIFTNAVQKHSAP